MSSIVLGNGEEFFALNFLLVYKTLYIETFTKSEELSASICFINVQNTLYADI